MVKTHLDQRDGDVNQASEAFGVCVDRILRGASECIPLTALEALHESARTCIRVRSLCARRAFRGNIGQASQKRENGDASGIVIGRQGREWTT